MVGGADFGNHCSRVLSVSILALSAYIQNSITRLLNDICSLAVGPVNNVLKQLGVKKGARCGVKSNKSRISNEP